MPHRGRSSDINAASLPFLRDRAGAWPYRSVIRWGMGIFEDLGAEQDQLEAILAGLDEGQWGTASGAAGWTVADVVLHLAQSEEAAAVTATRGTLRDGTLRGGLAAVAGD